MDLTRFLLAVLAAWRITHLLSNEDGPGDIVFQLRARLGSGLAGQLLDCFYCLSLWVAAGLALPVSRGVWGWILSTLAISGAACLLQRATEHSAVIRTHPEQFEP